MAGMRWKCAKCFDYDLCTPCYMSGKHIAEHAFVRHDTVRTRCALLASIALCFIGHDVCNGGITL